MRLHIKKLTGKLGFLAAIAAAAVIGGVSTGVVMASIPDSNGNLQTCYRNNGGDLRVIDTATQTCANNETAFNLTQQMLNGTTAFFRVKDGVVDTASMRNINDYEWTDEYTSNEGYCLDLSVDAKIALPGPGPLFRNNNAGEDDWLDNVCGTEFNAFFSTGAHPEWAGTLSVMFSE